jgi:hypothetical protein
MTADEPTDISSDLSKSLPSTARGFVSGSAVRTASFCTQAAKASSTAGLSSSDDTSSV